METLGLLALVVQVLTEAVARLYPRFTIYVAAVLGLAVAFVADVGLLESLGKQAGNHLADVFLAGLLLAGGSGLVQKLKQRLDPKTMHLRPKG